MSEIQRESPMNCYLFKSEKEVNKENHGECAICMEALDSSKNFAKTNCKHSFCLSCLMQSLKTNNTCPLCRTNIVNEKPKNEVKAIDFETSMNIVRDELDMLYVTEYVDAMQLYSNPRAGMKSMLKMFSARLVRSMVNYYHRDGYDEDEENDEDDEDDEDDEE